MAGKGRRVEDHETRQPGPDDWGPRTFTATADGRYTLALDGLGIGLSVSRLRRERSELVGELKATCAIAGARTIDGVLSIADFNLSSARARKERAGLLADRALAADVDWVGLVEELCLRVFEAERRGTPAQFLPEVALEDAADRDHVICGIPLSREDSTILFGDGGVCKSYLALYFAGELAKRGELVMYVDWESSAKGHRQRMSALWPSDGLPPLLYMRCDRPLVDEVDRLRRAIDDHGLTYLIFDSIGYGCDGPPEAAESALRYFRAVRQLGIGILMLAHISKAEDGDKRPFGSAFWHNSARATWHLKRADADQAHVVPLLASNRKTNLGQLLQPVGLEVQFLAQRTTIRPADPRDVAEFAKTLPLRHRLKKALEDGPRSIASLADEFDAKPDSIRKTLERRSSEFVQSPTDPSYWRLRTA